MFKTLMAIMIGAAATYVIVSPDESSKIVQYFRSSVHNMANGVASATAPTLSERIDQLLDSAKKSMDSAVN